MTISMPIPTGPVPTSTGFATGAGTGWVTGCATGAFTAAGGAGLGVGAGTRELLRVVAGAVVVDFTGTGGALGAGAGWA
jgi:hypothetical protein